MEFSLTVRYIKNPHGQACIRYGVSPMVRYMAVFFLVVLAVAILLTGGTGLVGVLFVLVSALLALYEERWDFDGNARTIVARSGLLLLNKKNLYPFDSIETLELDDFTRGRLDQTTVSPEPKMPYGSQSRLFLKLKNGQRILVNSVSYRRRPVLEGEILAIAQFSGIKTDIPAAPVRSDSFRF
jgi:hypothetical protein